MHHTGHGIVSGAVTKKVSGLKAGPGLEAGRTASTRLNSFGVLAGPRWKKVFTTVSAVAGSYSLLLRYPVFIQQSFLQYKRIPVA